jgi:hypothetical protein
MDNNNCSNIKKSIVISIILFVSIIGIILYYQEKQLNTFISTTSHFRLLKTNLTNIYIDLKNDLRDNKKSLNHLLKIVDKTSDNEYFNNTMREIIDIYKISSHHIKYREFNNCFPLSDYNDIIEKLFDINYNNKTYSFNYNEKLKNKVLSEILNKNNYIVNDDNDNDNDNDNNNTENYYYDEDFNKLYMNKKEYYEYLWSKYIEFDKTIFNFSKDNFIENLKYYFELKNKNSYKFLYKIINNDTNRKNCILNKNPNIKQNNFNYEYSLIPINQKDYDNHYNDYNLNQLNNYYGYMCNTHKKLCGNFNNYYVNNDNENENDNYVYYYPYFKLYNVNIFNYIFNKMYKSFVNFDIEMMIKKIKNIDEMSKNILVGFPIEDKNIINIMFSDSIKPTKII